MNQRTVLLELSPARLRAVVLRGRTPDAAMTVVHDASAWEAAWRDALRPLDGALSTIVRDLELRGARVEVHADTPTMLVEVFGSRAQGQAGLGAATLSLEDQAGFALAGNPWGVEAIGCDRAGEARQTHWLIAAERNDRARAIERWVQDAGLKLDRIVPLHAGSLAGAVRGAIAAGAGTRVRLHVGDARSILTVGGAGRLVLLRRIDLGVASLIEALTGPIRGAEGEIQLDAPSAAALLFTHGVPRVRGVIDEARGITGASVLPIIQPALQRCLVEVRQSLRFGLSEGDRSQMTLEITGPGASIPNMIEVLAEQLGLKPADEVRGESFDPSDPLDARSDLIASWRANAGLNLLSVEASATRRARSATRAMVAGAAAALGLAALDAGAMLMSIRAGERELSALNEQAQAAEELQDSADQMAELGDRRAALRRNVDSGTMGDAPLGAWLKELALNTPMLVRITEVDVSRDQGETVAMLRGFIVEPVEGEGEPVEIGRFVEVLQASDLVRSAALGATQRAAIDDRDALQFTVRVTLTGLPGASAALTEAPQ